MSYKGLEYDVDTNIDDYNMIDSLVPKNPKKSKTISKPTSNLLKTHLVPKINSLKLTGVGPGILKSTLSTTYQDLF